MDVAARVGGVQKFLQKCCNHRSLRDPPGDSTSAAPVQHRGSTIEDRIQNGERRRDSFWHNLLSSFDLQRAWPPSAGREDHPVKALRWAGRARGKWLLQLSLNCPSFAAVKRKPSPPFEVIEGRCAGPEVCPLSRVKAGAVVCIKQLSTAPGGHRPAAGTGFLRGAADQDTLPPIQLHLPGLQRAPGHLREAGGFDHGGGGAGPAVPEASDRR